MSSIHDETWQSAVATNLGIFYQPIYALWLLLDPSHQISAMSLETGDDVTADAANGKDLFYQLKHHGISPPKLTLQSPDLWKSIAGWSRILQTSISTDGLFLLVTTAEVSSEPELSHLVVKNLTNPHSRRAYMSALQALTKIATRVKSEHASGNRKHKKLIDGCRAFLDLPLTAQRDLVRRIRLCPKSWRIDEAAKKLMDRLHHVPDRYREWVARGLLEWWLNRTVGSLTGSHPRLLEADEVRVKLASLIADYTANDRLSSDFYGVDPPPPTCNASRTSNMQRQIELVEGGPTRLRRAQEHYWQSRNQRHRWMETGQLTPGDLVDFDRNLTREWKHKWGIIKDDLGADPTPDQERRAGLSVLDWAADQISGAPARVKPRDTWTHGYFTHGACHYLAEQLKAGWHPRWDTLIKPEE